MIVAPPKRWIVQLFEPMIVGTRFHGIERQEVIDTLILQSLPPGSTGEPAEDVIGIWKSIDWHRSDPMLMEEFECCDLSGAIQQAHRDAMRRAEAFCDATRDTASYADALDRKVSPVRLAYDAEGDAA